MDTPKYLLESIPQTKESLEELRKELEELRKELRESIDEKKHLHKNNMTLTNEVKKLREELAKKCKRTEGEHTKLQNEAKILGRPCYISSR